ncbi:LpqN/LpqT family lipoprotein [Mycobacterium sp. HM-7]
MLADPNGLLVGTKADSAAGYSLDRYEPTPKRAVGRATVLLGDSEFRPPTLVAAVYAAIIGEAVRQHNHVPPSQLVLTHPVDWTDRRLDVLREAVMLAGTQLEISLPTPLFVPEPVAAATYYARLEASDDERTARIGAATKSADAGDEADEEYFAVYDLGGGTFDATVLSRSSGGFEILSTGGIDPLGGFEFDNRLFNYLGQTHYKKIGPSMWQALAHPDPDDPDSGMRRRFLDATVRQVKEDLSGHTQRTVRLPGLAEPVLVTRAEFENLIRSDLQATITELEATLSRAGLTPDQLAGIYRIGGSSRIPLVGNLLDQFQRPVHVVDHPKTVVALGAAIESADSAGSAATVEAVEPKVVDAQPMLTPKEVLVNAVTLLHRSGKWHEVVAKADELARLSPRDPDPGGMVADAREKLRQADLADRYARGVDLLHKAQWREAIRTFVAIEDEEPGYRDTSALINAAQKLDETTGSERVSTVPPAAQPAVQPSPSPSAEAPRHVTAPRATTESHVTADSRGLKRPAVVVGAAAAAVVVVGVVIAIFSGQDSPSTNGPDANSADAGSSLPSLGASSEAPRPINTIDDYLKANGIQSVAVSPTTPGAPHIELPVPPGWTRMPEGAGGNYFAVVLDTPAKPDDAPRFVVTVDKLVGNVDTEKILALASGAAQQLQRYNGDPPVRAALSDFPGARFVGHYVKNDQARMIAEYVVVIPGTDGTYLMRISTDSPDVDAGAVMAAAKVFSQKTKITV